MIGLAVLYDWGRRAECAPFPCSVELRAVLALLHAHSNGDRRPYDAFWKAATQPRGKQPSEAIEKIVRGNNMHGAWHGILRTFGLEASIDLMTAIHSVNPSKGKSDGPL